MRVTPCVYRVAPGSEILHGMFDVEKGTLVQYPELYLIRIGKVYNFNVTLDRSPKGVTRSELVSVMDKDEDLLLAIDFLGTGIIYVYSDHVTHSSNEDPSMVQRIYTFEKSPLRLKVVRKIGGKLTRLVLPDRCQKFTYIVTVLRDGREYVYTQDGSYPLDADVDEYVGELNNKAYQAAYSYGAFGYTIKDGNFHFLRLVNGKLKREEVITC